MAMSVSIVSNGLAFNQSGSDQLKASLQLKAHYEVSFLIGFTAIENSIIIK